MKNTKVLTRNNNDNTVTPVSLVMTTVLFGLALTTTLHIFTLLA